MSAKDFSIFDSSNTKKQVWSTAYDANQASILVEAEVDAILVGDSLGMTFGGQKDTKGVTIDDMCYHTKVVARNAENIPVIADLPAGSYEDADQALESAQKLIEAGADAIKIEGGRAVLEQIEKLVENDIKVVSHIGLTPQTMQDWRVQGTDETSALKIMEDAKLLMKRGIKALLIECVTEELGSNITIKSSVPTIGIGAGPKCSGQVLVFDDIVGMSPSTFQPKFVKRYSNIRETIKQSIVQYKKEVEEGRFPDKKHSYQNG